MIEGLIDCFAKAKKLLFGHGLGVGFSGCSLRVVRKIAGFCVACPGYFSCYRRFEPDFSHTSAAACRRWEPVGCADWSVARPSRLLGPANVLEMGSNAKSARF